MMKKKFALKTLFSIFLGIGIISATVEDATMHMEKIGELFSKYSLDTFKLINGHDFGGTGGSDETKESQQSERSEIAMALNFKDPKDYIVGIKNSVWASNQREPMKVGQSAMTLTDADGRALVPLFIDAVKRLPDGTVRSGGKATVSFPVMENGHRVTYVAVVWNSENLLKRKNDTGEKFILVIFTKPDPAIPAA